MSTITTKRMPGRRGGASRPIRRQARYRSSRCASESKTSRRRRQRSVAPSTSAAAASLPFARLSDDELLSLGLPADWLGDVRAASEDAFLELAPHLPAEAAESLLQFATTGFLNKPAPAPADPYAHPDAQRRFRVIENVEELAQALDSPWDKWMVFLHPSQREIVDRDFSGPARVAGSAGTGKTIVALHRAVRLAKASPNARVLLATFSNPLAASLATKVRLLAGPETSVIPRIRVASLSSIAAELLELATGRRAHIAKDDQIARALEKAATDAGLNAKLNFLRSEWAHVVDAWQVRDAAEYLAVPRLGRDRRLGSKQRERFWPVFAAARADLEARGFTTWPGVFTAATQYYAAKSEKPFSHVVIDEAQDLGVPELRFLAAIAPVNGEWPLFLRRPRPAHLSTALLLEGARRRHPRARRDSQGQLSHVASNPPRGGSPSSRAAAGR